MSTCLTHHSQHQVTSAALRALAAIVHPTLFSSLILVDPIIFPYVGEGMLDPRAGVPDSIDRSKTVIGAIQRRDRWSSRYVALASRNSCSRAL